MVQEYILYGAGNCCRKLIHILNKSEIKVVAVVDTNFERWGTMFEGYKIESPLIIKEYPLAKICITVFNNKLADDIRSYIQDMYLSKIENEIRYYELILEAYKFNSTILEIIKKFSINIEKSKSFLFDASNGLGLGGVERWTLDICENLIRSGLNNVYVLSDNGKYDIIPLLRQHILYAKIDHKEEFQEENIAQLVTTILEQLPCKVITQSVNDVMLASYLIKTVYPNLIEIISVVHNSHDEMYEKYSAFKACSDQYVGVSQDIIENINYMLNVPSECIYSMNIPFICEPVLNRKYTILPEQTLRIGYAGRIEIGQKRMDLLLKVVAELAKRNVDFRIELAGDGSYLEKMKRDVSKQNLNHYVKFLGKLEHSEIADFWKHQDICVNIADYEGRSISITEAMGAGAIPIVTATSGVKEDIESGKNGYIVPLGDYNAMADRIEYLSRHREKLYSMGELAHKEVYPKSLMNPHILFWKGLLLEKEIL